ncbi:MAG: hypothetical protein ACP5GX_08145 [Anaerolineae bacterium]
MRIEGQGALYTAGKEKLADVEYLILATEEMDASESRITQVWTNHRIFVFDRELILETEESKRYKFLVTTKFPDHIMFAGYTRPE